MDREDRLDGYMDDELGMLEHFRYPNLFIRDSKNVYISFVSKKLLDVVLVYRPNLTHDDPKSRLRKRHFSIHLKDLRKLHRTMLREYMPAETIDLLHGRVSSSILLRFCYRPFLQDIRDKVMKALAPLEKQLLTLL